MNYVLNIVVMYLDTVSNVHVGTMSSNNIATILTILYLGHDYVGANDEWRPQKLPH